MKTSRTLGGALVLVLTAGFVAAQQPAGTLCAAGDKGTAGKRERVKLQGVWAVTELTEANKKASDKKAQSLRIEFQGEASIIISHGKAALKGTYTVDREKSPATMDITYEKDGKTVTIPALYELKGDDLKLCHPSAEGGSRPNAIEATANTVLLTLKRQKS